MLDFYQEHLKFKNTAPEDEDAEMEGEQQQQQQD